MGELIAISEFFDAKNAFRESTQFAIRRFEEYFPGKVEVVDSSYNRRTNWEETILQTFPERVAIHWDAFKEDHLWIEIRRFVRDHCADAIWLQHDKTYSYLHRYTSTEQRAGLSPIEKKHAYRSKVEHGYTAFYFETAIDAVQFGLKFADKVSTIEDRHPSRRDVPEDEIADAEAHPHGIYEEW
jgi:hypothetical protein